MSRDSQPKYMRGARSSALPGTVRTPCDCVCTSSLSELFWGPVVEQLTWVIALSRKTSLVYIPGRKKIQEQQPAGVDS